MATPFDVVSKHRLQAWAFFSLVMGGFLALCIGTTVWHAHQRNHPPIAMKYLNDPVKIGDISICLTNEWGFFPVNLTGLQASCVEGSAFSVPTVEQINDVVPLASVPSVLSNSSIFLRGVTSFNANQDGCAITQSFRTGLLGSVPKNCFRFATHNIGFQVNTSVTLSLTYQSTTYTNTADSTVNTYTLPPGSQAALALFTDGLNSLNSFEMSYQALNFSSINQLAPSVRMNIKNFPNGNNTETFANPSTTPFNFAAPAGRFISTSSTYVQMVITTTPKGYLLIQEQDPLSALVLLPAYGGFWPYFIVAFGLFFTAEPNMGIRPFIVRFGMFFWTMLRPAKAQRQSSARPIHLDGIDSATMGEQGMTESERKERAYMAAQKDKLENI